MEDQVNRLVEKVWDKYLNLAPERRYMIAIAGIPGSGKTTLCKTVADALNGRHSKLHSSEPPIAAAIPMDGYHLTRAKLSAMPDPQNAHARRGAEFTFDSAAYLSLITSLRAPLFASSTTILAPAFDHAIKDPTPDAISIAPSHRIVVLEGNYLCLNRKPWSDAAALMDERWFVEVDFGVARRRLVRRHVAAGIAADEEAAGRRADENDLVNGKEIVDGLVDVDEVVVSREDDEWVHG